MTYAFEGSRFYFCHCFFWFALIVSFPRCSSLEIRACLTGRTVVLWLRLHSLSHVASYGHGFLSTQPFLLVFNFLYNLTLTLPLCLLSCMKSFLQICHCILTKCQTELLVAIVLLETNLGGRCISSTPLLYYFLPGVTIFDFRNHLVTAFLHIHLAQNSLNRVPII